MYTIVQPLRFSHWNRVQNGGVAALTVSGRFVFDSANHRDFLGACLGTGIERGKVGDILVTGETGAHIMIVPELVEHLEQTLTQVVSFHNLGRCQLLSLDHETTAHHHMKDLSNYEMTI